MTGDDHGNGGTAGRFDQYVANSPAGCSVADWECLRYTSYIYPSTPLTNAQATTYAARLRDRPAPVHRLRRLDGSSLAGNYTAQLATGATVPGVPSPVTNRLHCIVWSRLRDQPKVERTERHPAGHQLLLLAGLLGRRPAGLHDRLRHADAVRREDRRPHRRLPGGDPDDRRVRTELSADPEHPAGQRDWPSGTTGVRREHAHRCRHDPRERPQTPPRRATCR